jgi:hypothetical protein
VAYEDDGAALSVVFVFPTVSKEGDEFSGITADALD